MVQDESSSPGGALSERVSRPRMLAGRSQYSQTFRYEAKTEDAVLICDLFAPTTLSQENGDRQTPMRATAHWRLDYHKAYGIAA